METLDKYIKRKRNEQKLTLREVEKITGIQNAYLSMLENGKIKRPAPEILKKLSDAFKISYENLLEIAGYPMPTVQKSRAMGNSKMLHDLTFEEESKLIEYLKFLRSQKD